MIKLSLYQIIVLGLTITAIILSIPLLIFADSRDFIISCDEYSIDSGISCPLKK